MEVLISYKPHANRYQASLVLFANTNPQRDRRRASPRSLTWPDTRGPGRAADAPTPHPHTLPLTAAGGFGVGVANGVFLGFRKAGNRADLPSRSARLPSPTPSIGVLTPHPRPQPTRYPPATGSGNTSTPTPGKETEAERRQITRKPW